ncbi:MAG: PLP-dependent aminotransferase family protein [Geminicoccaceae bacterium]
MDFDYTPFFRSDLPPAATKWSGFPRYNFVGGHNDADHVPVERLAKSAGDAVLREGRTLATYRLESGPLGYVGLREFIAAKLRARASMACQADDILITTGSLQVLDLVNAAFLEPGDTVIVEAASYAGTLSRLRAKGAVVVGVGLDEQGMRMDQLASVLDDLKSKGTRPKFLYTIPTVQNPTGTVMTKERRLEMLRLAAMHDFPIFEDDCYADLLWEGERPPAIRGLDEGGRVIYCGSFSKSIAPALRVGYAVAEWSVISRLLALKEDAGSGALEQMTLADYDVAGFDDHVEALQGRLKRKCDVMMAALDEQFGASAEFAVPKGGIFIWVTLPDQVDTSRLASVAAADGVAINPGAEWSSSAEDGRHRLRLCFAHPSETTIREGIAKLAEICHREFGTPKRSANIERR